MEIIWSPRAIKKIHDIGNYIAKDAPKRANAFIDRLLNIVGRLRDVPLSGQITPEQPAFRQIVMQGYRVIYRVQASAVEIVTVIAPKEDSKKISENK